MIEVSGYIDNLLANKKYESFLIGIEDKDDFLASMVDVPIIQNGKPIGVVNDIDFEDMTWSGVIWNNTLVEIDPCNKSIQSVHLIKQGGI